MTLAFENMVSMFSCQKPGLKCVIRSFGLLVYMPGSLQETHTLPALKKQLKLTFCVIPFIGIVLTEKSCKASWKKSATNGATQIVVLTIKMLPSFVSDLHYMLFTLISCLYRGAFIHMH